MTSKYINSIETEMNDFYSMKLELDYKEYFFSSCISEFWLMDLIIPNEIKSLNYNECSDLEMLTDIINYVKFIYSLILYKLYGYKRIYQTNTKKKADSSICRSFIFNISDYNYFCATF